MTLRRISMVAAALAAAACGGGLDAGGGDAALDAYLAVGAEMASAVEAYGDDMAAVPSGEACGGVHAGYGAHMDDAAGRMGDLSAVMDGHLAEGRHGGGMGDMGCVAEAIAAELGRHHAAACATGDLAADRAEAARHVETMGALLDHQRARGEAGGGMMEGGGGGMMGGGMTGGGGMMGGSGAGTFTCVRNPDGSFTFDGEPWTPGCLPGTPAP